MQLSFQTRKMALLLLTLALAWVLWSGYFTPLLLGLGLVSCLLTVYLAKRMGYFEPELFALRPGLAIFRFWLWLLVEIGRSSLAVARVVLDPKLPVSPQLLELDLSDQHPVDQVILGNSMTLTPGTLSVDLHNGKLLVHALTQHEARQVR
ncbi:MAG: Na+/H+ antiporter subunit E, partial [Gammaproteobacteria bacterium]|nr:Na+/H+ antiporter subunit E [Gammaproteobacteria bacterium]